MTTCACGGAGSPRGGTGEEARAPWIGSCVAVACLAAAGAAAGPPDPESKVSVRSTKDPAEEREKVPITRSPRAERKVAISMSANEMPTIRRGDRLRISAEIETTNNCRRPGSLCVTRPYGYDPRVGLQLVVARGATDTHGPRTMALTQRRQRTCRQREPHREHHCVAVFRNVGLRIDDPDDFPCVLRDCVVNLVVDASNPRAGSNEHILLGIDRPGGRGSSGSRTDQRHPVPGAAARPADAADREAPADARSTSRSATPSCFTHRS